MQAVAISEWCAGGRDPRVANVFSDVFAVLFSVFVLAEGMAAVIECTRAPDHLQ